MQDEKDSFTEPTQPCSHTSQPIPDVLENLRTKISGESKALDAEQPATQNDAFAARSESGSAKISKTKDDSDQTQLLDAAMEPDGECDPANDG